MASHRVSALFVREPAYFADLMLLQRETRAAADREGVSIDLSTVPPDDEDALLEAIGDVEVVVASRITERALRAGRRLKLVQLPYTGVEHLDLAMFRQQRRTWLANSHATAAGTAEQAWALLMALAKRILDHDRDLRAGKWHNYLTAEPAMELRGRAVAVIGLGAVGKEVARLANAFGMQVHGIKRRLNQGDEAWKATVHALGAGTEALHAALRACDFTVLCVPRTPETIGLIGAQELELLRGKYLVNVSRGVVVDEEALFRALQEGTLAGAGIDTWYVYPRGPQEAQATLPGHFPFHQLPNVIMSPHSAGYTDRYLRENLHFILHNIARVARGEVPESLVDVERGY